MKIGICINEGLEKIEYAAKCGFDYIEYRFHHFALSNDEDFEALCKTLEKNNIKCESVNCFLPASFTLIGKDIDYTEVKEYIEKGMIKCQKIGLDAIVFGSGKSRAIPDGLSYDDAFRQIVYFLKEIVAPLAEKYNITVVIEPLGKSDTNFINTVKEGAMVAAAVNHKYIKVLADSYHMYNSNDDFDNICDLKGVLYHAHIADKITRATPTKESEEFCKNYLDALKKAGCERCSIEATHKDFFAEIPEGLKILKSLI